MRVALRVGYKYFYTINKKYVKLAPKDEYKYYYTTNKKICKVDFQDWVQIFLYY